MRVNDDYRQCNAEHQQSDPSSVLQYWRRCLHARKEAWRSLIYGKFQMHDAENESIMAYSRLDEESRETALVVVNFTDGEKKWRVPGEYRKLLDGGRLALSTYGTDSPPKVTAEGGISLRPFESFVVVG